MIDADKTNKAHDEKVEEPKANAPKVEQKAHDQKPSLPLAEPKVVKPLLDPKAAPATSSKLDLKAVEPAPKVDQPYPSQADLDAMREGKLGQNRQVVAEENPAGYKTR